MTALQTNMSEHRRKLKAPEADLGMFGQQGPHKKEPPQEDRQNFVT